MSYKILENHIRDTFSWCNDPKHLATKPIPLPKIPLTNFLRELREFEKNLTRKVVDPRHGASWSSLRSDQSQI